MASVEIRQGGSTGQAAYREFARPAFVEFTLTGEDIRAAKGSDLVATDTIELMTIPANTIVKSAILNVVNADSGTTLTFDLGDEDQGDRWVDGADITTTGIKAQGTNGQTDEVRVYSADNILRATVASITSANNDYDIQVIIELADITGNSRAIPAKDRPTPFNDPLS